MADACRVGVATSSKEAAMEEGVEESSPCLSFQEAVKLSSSEARSSGRCVDIDGTCVPAHAALALRKEFAGKQVGQEYVIDSVQPDVREVEPASQKLLRALAAEAVGTCIIVLFGCGAVCSTLTGAFSGIWQVAVVWGFGVAIAIYCTAEASGAHLNPAVTLAFFLVRPKAHDLNVFKCVYYVLAQLAGAILGATINLIVYNSTFRAFERANNIVRGEPASIKTACAFGEYFPNPGLSVEWGSGPYTQDDVTPIYALLVEAWGTFVLCFCIFCFTNKHNTALEVSGARPGVPFMIGFVVAVNLTLYAPITQAGWNPARDFGPRLVAFVAGWGEVAIPGPRNGFWIYILGPLLGGPPGAALGEYLMWPRREYSRKE